jgi:GTP-binding protein
VGKSTLFNRIIGRRQAIVEDVEGVTRDRIYGAADWLGHEFTIVDTGGFDPDADSGFLPLIRSQTMVAIEEADIIILVLDTRTGLSNADEEVVKLLRRSNKPVLVAANKAEGKEREMEAAQFYSLGLDPVFPISAQHGVGVAELLDELVEVLPEKEVKEEVEHDLRVAVVGRPNTGKSTLINRILDEDRHLVSDIPGTTVDAIDSLVIRDEKKYLFVDTAGVRRKSRIDQNLERSSVLRTIKALERCDVVVMLIDTEEGLVEQDVRIAGLVEDRGKPMILCLNKWDLVDKDHRTFDETVKDLKEKLFFFKHVPMISISGLTGMRVDRIFEAIDGVHEQGGTEVNTSDLNNMLDEAVARFQPPLVRGKRLKFFYATQIDAHPPTFLIFTNRPGEIRDNYISYLERFFRENLGLEGTPVRLRFRRGREDRRKK